LASKNLTCRIGIGIEEIEVSKKLIPGHDMYGSEVDVLMKRMTGDALHYLIEHVEIVSSVL
jgi:hypothetical protein